LAVSKFMTLFWGAAQTAVALGSLWIGSQRSIIGQVLTVAGLTTGLVLGLFLLGSMRRPVSSNAALVGFAAGVIAVLVCWLPSTWGPAILGWPWFAPLGMSMTVGVAIILDRLVFQNGSTANGSAQPGIGESR
jgi:hypothetical protein